ncbi:hypothetical protein ACHAQJ_002041 [Trichoderma viride]
MAARITARRFLSTFSQTQRPSLVRTMATSGVRRPYEFLVVIQDKPGPEVRAKRLEVRAQHFREMKPTLEKGFLKMGGAILNDIPENDDDLDFAGTALVLVAESAEDAKNLLKDDIYNTAGVWDFEKAQVYPLKCGFRFAL